MPRVNLLFFSSSCALLLMCFGLFIFCVGFAMVSQQNANEPKHATNTHAAIVGNNNELCIVCHCVCSFSSFFFLLNSQCSTVLFKFDFFSLPKSNIIIFHMDYSFFFPLVLIPHSKLSNKNAYLCLSVCMLMIPQLCAYLYMHICGLRNRLRLPFDVCIYADTHYTLGSSRKSIDSEKWF